MPTVPFILLPISLILGFLLGLWATQLWRAAGVRDRSRSVRRLMDQYHRDGRGY